MAIKPGNNMTAKILALVLAAILWIYVMNEQNPPIETTFTVPLEVRNLSEGLLLMDNPDTVRIKVRGPRSLVAGVIPQDLKAYIDMRGLKEGRYTQKVYSIAPSSIEVLEINPDKLVLRAEIPEQRQIPVEIRITGSNLGGAVAAKATASVATAKVEGPRNMVDAVDKVIAVIDLTGKNADFTATVPLQPLNRDGKAAEGVTISPETVSITVGLERGPNQKQVDVRTTVHGELPAGASLKSVTTEPNKIQVSGNPELLKTVEFVYTEPVNLAGITQTTTKEVKLQLLDGVVAPRNTVMVKIEVESK